MLGLLIAGLPLGAMYGLAALGLVAVHRATRKVDLSLGAVATASAFAYHRLSAGGPLPAPAAALVALGLAAGIGAIGAALARRVGPGRPLAATVASLALGGLVLAACSALFGTETQFVAPLLPGVRWRLAGTVLSGHQIVVLAVAAGVVGGGSVLLRRTAGGLAWTATAGDRTGAAVVGLPVRRIETSSSVVAAILAGTAGILLAPLLFLDPVQLTAFFLVKPFAAAVVAGLTSLPVALGAGLVMGILESLSIRVQEVPGLGETVPFVLVALALLRRERRVREVAAPAFDRAPSRLPGQGRLWPAAAVCGALLLVAPHQSPYQATITQLAGVTALLAATHVVLTGWTGRLSLAQPALAGIGAITAARLGAGAGLPLPLSLAGGALMAAGAAAIVGVVAGRASGMGFAALTLAFSTACSAALFNWGPFAGAAEERALPPAALGPLTLDGPRFTWVVVTVAAAAFIALRALARGRWGAAMVAVREHDRAAVALGIPSGRVRWTAFTVTGALAGLAGALGAHQLQTVAPEQFHPLTAVPLLSVAVVGGIESLWGAAFGAAFLTLAPEALRHATSPTGAAFLPPAALLLTVLLRPGGLTSLGRPRLGRGAAGAPVTSAEGAPDEAPATPTVEALTVDALTVEGLTVRYGRFTAVDGVDLVARPGEVVALVGPNGAGKTTVLDAVSGFVRPGGGRIGLGRLDLAGLPASGRAAAGVIRTLQAGALFPRLSLRDNLDLAARWHRRPPPGPELLEAAGVLPYADQPAASLPLGIARAAEIVRAVSLRPTVLLLDEPAAGLGRSESTALMAMLRATAGTAAVLLVEHDQHVVALADRAVVLHQGRVLADGPPREALRHPEVLAAYLGEPVVPAGQAAGGGGEPGA